MKWLVGIALLCTVWMVNAQASSNPYLTSRNYDMIKVKTNDTVWDIALQRASDREDVRDLVKAIKDINALDNNARVHPGQVLKVPIK